MLTGRTSRSETVVTHEQIGSVDMPRLEHVMTPKGIATSYEEDYVVNVVECLMTDPNMAGVQVMVALWNIRLTFVTENVEIENRFQCCCKQAPSIILSKGA